MGEERQLALSKKDLIPFVSGLEREGYSIVEVIPTYHLDKLGPLSKLLSVFNGRRKYSVITAKDLGKSIKRWDSTPSRVLLSPYASLYFDYILIHTYQPSSPDDYKVNFLRKDYDLGLKNVPVSDTLLLKELLAFLK